MTCASTTVPSAPRRFPTSLNESLCDELSLLVGPGYSGRRGVKTTCVRAFACGRRKAQRIRPRASMESREDDDMPLDLRQRLASRQGEFKKLG